MSIQLKNYTEPTIVTTDDLSHRSFISFTLNSKPQRLYHGKNIAQQINPNRAKTLEEKLRLLKKLQFELHKALEANNYPVQNIDIIQSGNFTTLPYKIVSDPPLIRLLFEAIRTKLRSGLS